MPKRKPSRDTLFELPPVLNIKLTKPQKHVLDLVLLLDGKPVVDNGHGVQVNKQALRNTLRYGLVEVVACSPARYRVTPTGRAVRTSGLLRGMRDDLKTA
jgi:hypothetical protein